MKNKSLFKEYLESVTKTTLYILNVFLAPSIIGFFALWGIINFRNIFRANLIMLLIFLNFYIIIWIAIMIDCAMTYIYNKKKEVQNDRTDN